MNKSDGSRQGIRDALKSNQGPAGGQRPGDLSRPQDHTGQNHLSNRDRQLEDGKPVLPKK